MQKACFDVKALLISDSLLSVAKTATDLRKVVDILQFEVASTEESIHSLHRALHSSEDSDLTQTLDIQDAPFFSRGDVDHTTNMALDEKHATNMSSNASIDLRDIGSSVSASLTFPSSNQHAHEMLLSMLTVRIYNETSLPLKLLLRTNCDCIQGRRRREATH